MQPVERALRDLERHERLHRETGGGDVHVRPVSGDDAGALHPFQPRLHGGAGHLDRAGQIQDPGARGSPQRRQQGQVQRVQDRFVSHPSLPRQPAGHPGGSARAGVT
ncbi:MAG TPA: hypothetical protein VKV33_00510 [Streptosporangiaceae bacterium]|nr:hypothetical protein [Streptosporangiaceae bacterium]